MKLGFVSAILGSRDFESVIDIAAELGFGCVELACWPVEKTERRYAGISHLDIDNLTPQSISEILDYCKEKNVVISSLGYYPNYLSGDTDRRENALNHLKKLIKASRALDVNMVTTFIGRNQYKTMDENLRLFSKTWAPIVKLAEDNGVKIGIENCPMLFGEDQWPGGQNLAVSPHIWRQMFTMIDSKCFGLNYDPSHFIWQMMDYISPIYEFKDKIFHVHIKDVKLHPEKLNQHGILSYPLDFMSPKLPGLGDVNWGKFMSALTDIGYDGLTCIEMEDRAFESSEAKILDGLSLAKRYMSQFII